MTAELLHESHVCQWSNAWQCAARRSPRRLIRRGGRRLDLASSTMITMTEWEEDMGDVVREGEATNAKAQNLKELFKRADLDGCDFTDCM